MTAAAAPTTEYTIQVYVNRVWATGTPRGTGWATIKVTEESSIIGSMRAIEAAVAQVADRELCYAASPKLSPNPAQLGWPVSL